MPWGMPAPRRISSEQQDGTGALEMEAHPDADCPMAWAAPPAFWQWGCARCGPLSLAWRGRSCCMAAAASRVTDLEFLTGRSGQLHGRKGDAQAAAALSLPSSPPVEVWAVRLRFGSCAGEGVGCWASVQGSRLRAPCARSKAGAAHQLRPHATQPVFAGERGVCAVPSITRRIWRGFLVAVACLLAEPPLPPPGAVQQAGRWNLRAPPPRHPGKGMWILPSCDTPCLRQCSAIPPAAAVASALPAT